MELMRYYAREQPDLDQLVEVSDGLMKYLEECKDKERGNNQCEVNVKQEYQKEEEEEEEEEGGGGGGGQDEDLASSLSLQ